MENFKTVVDWEKYEVSDLGRVRRKGSNSFLKPIVTAQGYLAVNLSDKPRRARININVLVLQAHLYRRPNGMLALHRDGNKQNNNLSNLYWGTKSDNTVDSVKHGSHNNARKLTCPEGHRLSGENLVPARAKLGWRNCRTCPNAKKYSKRHGIPLEEAMRYYYDKYKRGL